MAPLIEFAGRKVGPGYHVFIMAKAGGNNNAGTELSVRLVKPAREAGVERLPRTPERTRSNSKPG